jgi:Flp pilus assembly pilin Flp
VSDTHYEILGVSPDASRDQIRDAYRARVSELDPESWKGDASERRERAASVNKAWNVLSDPFQKERYDSGIDDSIEGIDDIDVDSDVSDGAARNGKGGGKAARGNAAVVQARGAVKITPTGLTIAPTRARINALSVDVLVILVLVFGLNFIAGALFSNPAVQITIRDKVVSTTEIKDSTAEAVKKAQQPKAEAKWEKDNPKAKPLKPKDVKVDKVKVVPSTITLIFQLLTLVLALLYTVIPSARTGQTRGKRIFKIKLVSVDGGPVGWAQALLHYGVPIAVAIALALLGAVVAIGMVLWSIWDKNGQGVDDKIAKTFVVEV